MRRLAAILSLLIFAATGLFAGNKSKFPAVDNGGKTAIVAHRGFWKNNGAKDSQNSIAAFSLAQSNGFWGSECDIHLTADGEIIVNHDPTIDGLSIAEHSYAELSEHLLPNGEKRPTFDEYLSMTRKKRSTVLVVELKAQGSDARDEALIQKALKSIKSHGLYNPRRVAFISFSYYTCKRIAQIAPKFTNQYLSGNKAPDEVASDGINGIDYNGYVLLEHPDWIECAHKLGMSVNVWTIDNEENMRKCIEYKVDAITTNEPLKLRGILGDNELKK